MVCHYRRARPHRPASGNKSSSPGHVHPRVPFPQPQASSGTFDPSRADAIGKAEEKRRTSDVALRGRADDVLREGLVAPQPRRAPLVSFVTLELLFRLRELVVAHPAAHNRTHAALAAVIADVARTTVSAAVQQWTGTVMNVYIKLWLERLSAATKEVRLGGQAGRRTRGADLQVRATVEEHGLPWLHSAVKAAGNTETVRALRLEACGCSDGSGAPWVC